MHLPCFAKTSSNKYFRLSRDLEKPKIATKTLEISLNIKEMLPSICKRLRLHSHYYQITISSYFGKGQTHLFDFTILLWEWKTLILIERIFFQPTWLPCKSPYKECRNSCGTSCRVAVELPAYSVKVKVDTTKSRKQIPKSFWVLYL